MRWARRLTERLSRGRTFWRRLPPPFSAARILVSPDAALSVLRPGSRWADQELLSIVDRFVQPGHCVWDIGGNLGIFAAASGVRAGAGGSVLCVEPDIFLAGLVRQTAARMSRDCARISVLPAAVAAKAGIAEFQIAQRGRASNALAEFGGRSPMGGVRETVLTPVVTLDSLLNVSAPPNLIKIDVEGAEHDVLLGAQAVLKEAAPLVYIEVGEQNVQAVTDCLRAAGYRLHDAQMPIGNQKSLERCVWNTLALPNRMDG